MVIKVQPFDFHEILSILQRVYYRYNKVKIKLDFNVLIFIRKKKSNFQKCISCIHLKA